MPSTVTQKEIARHIGVTPVLVSRALAGHPSVARHTRERIEQVALELGYDTSSNLEARSLVARRYGKKIQTDILAVLMPAAFFRGTALPRVPFFAPLIDGIHEAAGEAELDIHLCSPRDSKLPRLIERGGVDGVICLSQYPREIEELDLPTVSFGGPGGRMMGLYADSRRGARLATEHLLQLGHRRIACLAFSSSFTPGHWYAAAADRIDGYKDALTAAGIPVDPELMVGHLSHPTVEEGVAGMTHLLESGVHDFTAVICFNDLIAMGAIEVLRASGRRIPDDVSVAGFDDVSEHYPFLPKITSVFFDRFLMGRRAVQWICDTRGKTSEERAASTIDEVFPVQLVVRESTAPPSA